MKRNPIRLGALLAALFFTAGGPAFAQSDNTNSATDPTYYDSWYYFYAPPSSPYWRDGDFERRQWYAYAPSSHARGPAYYESWRYYDAPTRYYPAPGVTPLGTVTAPGYSGPRAVTP
ncbi:MAG: hypothetical protein ABI585_00645 [Betaproteobacteria bacterium]